ncbi:MAG TPA: MBL fold metallo-hydrolase [Myxococcota bacterium]|nr:MBL fold metallo-hydrolase [Myxococcota bacterium]
MAKFLLFDAGDGAQRSMESQQLPIADIDAVFLTHFHSDHMADLGEVISRSWILGRQHLLPIYGGPAVDRVVQGYRSAYSPDVTYRNAHHASEVFPEPSLHAEAVQLEQAPATGVVIYEQGGVRVWAYGVDHSPVSPAVGYRIEYGGRAIGISGDTVDSDGLRNLASNADLLVSEVMDKTLVLDTACALEMTETNYCSGISAHITPTSWSWPTPPPRAASTP